MIALDTSALAKLLVEEAESQFLEDAVKALFETGEDLMLSSLAVTELRRLSIRLDLPYPNVERLVRPYRILRVTEGILHLGSRLPYRDLGALDAIHVATALIAEVGTLITYDDRQAEAAQGEGLRVLCPGR